MCSIDKSSLDAFARELIAGISPGYLDESFEVASEGFRIPSPGFLDEDLEDTTPISESSDSASSNFPAGRLGASPSLTSFPLNKLKQTNAKLSHAPIHQIKLQESTPLLKESFTLTDEQDDDTHRFHNEQPATPMRRTSPVRLFTTKHRFTTRAKRYYSSPNYENNCTCPNTDCLDFSEGNDLCVLHGAPKCCGCRCEETSKALTDRKKRIKVKNIETWEPYEKTSPSNSLYKNTNDEILIPSSSSSSHSLLQPNDCDLLYPSKDLQQRRGTSPMIDENMFSVVPFSQQQDDVNNGRHSAALNHDYDCSSSTHSSNGGSFNGSCNRQHHQSYDRLTETQSKYHNQLKASKKCSTLSFLSGKDSISTHSNENRFHRDPRYYVAPEDVRKTPEIPSIRLHNPQLGPQLHPTPPTGYWLKFSENEQYRAIRSPRFQFSHQNFLKEHEGVDATVPASSNKNYSFINNDNNCINTKWTYPQEQQLESCEMIDNRAHNDGTCPVNCGSYRRQQDNSTSQNFCSNFCMNEDIMQEIVEGQEPYTEVNKIHKKQHEKSLTPVTRQRGELPVFQQHNIEGLCIPSSPQTPTVFGDTTSTTSMVDGFTTNDQHSYQKSRLTRSNHLNNSLNSPYYLVDGNNMSKNSKEWVEETFSPVSNQSSYCSFHGKDYNFINYPSNQNELAKLSFQNTKNTYKSGDQRNSLDYVYLKIPPRLNRPSFYPVSLRHLEPSMPKTQELNRLRKNLIDEHMNMDNNVLNTCDCVSASPEQHSNKQEYLDTFIDRTADKNSVSLQPEHGINSYENTKCNNSFVSDEILLLTNRFRDSPPPPCSPQLHHRNKNIHISSRLPSDKRARTPINRVPCPADWERRQQQQQPNKHSHDRSVVLNNELHENKENNSSDDTVILIGVNEIDHQKKPLQHNLQTTTRTSSDHENSHLSVDKFSCPLIQGFSAHIPSNQNRSRTESASHSIVDTTDHNGMQQQVDLHYGMKPYTNTIASSRTHLDQKNADDSSHSDHYHQQSIRKNKSLSLCDDEPPLKIIMSPSCPPPPSSSSSPFSLEPQKGEKNYRKIRKKENSLLEQVDLQLDKKTSDYQQNLKNTFLEQSLVLKNNHSQNTIQCNNEKLTSQETSLKLVQPFVDSPLSSSSTPRPILRNTIDLLESKNHRNFISQHSSHCSPGLCPVSPSHVLEKPSCYTSKEKLCFLSQSKDQETHTIIPEPLESQILEDATSNVNFHEMSSSLCHRSSKSAHWSPIFLNNQTSIASSSVHPNTTEEGGTFDILHHEKPSPSFPICKKTTSPSTTSLNFPPSSQFHVEAGSYGLKEKKTSINERKNGTDNNTLHNRTSTLSFGCQVVYDNQDDIQTLCNYSRSPRKLRLYKENGNSRRFRYKTSKRLLTKKEKIKDANFNDTRPKEIVAPLRFFSLDELPNEVSSVLTFNQQPPSSKKILNKVLSSKQKPLALTDGSEKHKKQQEDKNNYKVKNETTEYKKLRPTRFRQPPLRWWMLERIEYVRPQGSECPIAIGVHRRADEVVLKSSKKAIRNVDDSLLLQQDHKDINQEQEEITTDTTLMLMTKEHNDTEEALFSTYESDNNNNNNKQTDYNLNSKKKVSATYKKAQKKQEDNDDNTALRKEKKQYSKGLKKIVSSSQSENQFNSVSKVAESVIINKDSIKGGNQSHRKRFTNVTDDISLSDTSTTSTAINNDKKKEKNNSLLQKKKKSSTNKKVLEHTKQADFSKNKKKRTPLTEKTRQLDNPKQDNNDQALVVVLPENKSQYKENLNNQNVQHLMIQELPQFVNHNEAQFVSIQAETGYFEVAIMFETSNQTVCELIIQPGRSKGIDQTLSNLLGLVVTAEEDKCLLQIGDSACKLTRVEAERKVKRKRKLRQSKEFKQTKNNKPNENQFEIGGVNDDLRNEEGVIIATVPSNGKRSSVAVAVNEEEEEEEELCFLLSRGHQLHIPPMTIYNFTNLSKKSPIVLSLTLQRPQQLPS